MTRGLILALLMVVTARPALTQNCDYCRQKAAEMRRMAAEYRARTDQPTTFGQAAVAAEEAAQKYDGEYGKCMRRQPTPLVQCDPTVGQQSRSNTTQPVVSDATANAQQSLSNFNQQMTGSISNAKQRLENATNAFQNLMDALVRAPPASTSPFRGIDFEQVEKDAKLNLLIAQGVSHTLAQLEQRLRDNAANAESEAERNWYLNQADDVARERQENQQFERMAQDIYLVSYGRARLQRQFGGATQSGAPAGPQTATGSEYAQQCRADPPDDLARQRREQEALLAEEDRWRANPKSFGKPCRFTDAPAGVDQYGTYDRSGNCYPRVIQFPDPGGRRNAVPMQADGWFPGAPCRFPNPPSDGSPTGRFDEAGKCIPDEVKFGPGPITGSREAVLEKPKPGDPCLADNAFGGGKTRGYVASNGACVAPDWKCERWSTPATVQMTYGVRKYYAEVEMQLDAYVTPPADATYYQTAKFTFRNVGRLPVRIGAVTLKSGESHVMATPPESPRDRIYSIQVSGCLM